MSTTLHPSDRKAIDLLLEHIGVSSKAATQFAAPDEAVRSRLGAANQVLSLLSQLPAEEPPADLVQRTLARIHGQAVNGFSSRDGRVDPLGPIA